MEIEFTKDEIATIYLIAGSQSECMHTIYDKIRLAFPNALYGVDDFGMPNAYVGDAFEDAWEERRVSNVLDGSNMFIPRYED